MGLLLRNCILNSYLVFFFNGEIISFSSIEFTRPELKPIEEVFVDRILTNVNIIASSSFTEDLKTWRTELVPLFISRCELLCFTQDINNSEDSLFHYLGIVFYFQPINFFSQGVCLYGVAELLVPCFNNCL